MKVIGIADFEKLVMERLYNPKKFAGRSLVVWNGTYMDYGIAYRIIKQCCEKFNKENPDDQIWFKRSDYTFKDDDYTQPKTWEWYDKMVWDKKSKEYVEQRDTKKMKRCGIIYNTGCFIFEEKDDWLKFVNTHTNNCGSVAQDCVLIAHAHSTNDAKKYNFKEEQFGSNCDIYSIQPTIDEWYKWAGQYYDTEIMEVVRAYIEINGVINGFDYWMNIMEGLRRLKSRYSRRENKEYPLCQIPEDEITFEILGIATLNHPAPDFCKFIHSFFEDKLKD